MICKYCNEENLIEEMKTKHKCLNCYRKQQADYVREYTKQHPEKKKASREKYLSNPENKEKKNKHDNEYYHKNKEEINKKQRESLKIDPVKHQKKKDLDKKYYEQVKNDPEKLENRNEYNRELARKWRAIPEKAERMREINRNWSKRNRDSINEYRRNKRKTDDNYRIADNLRKGLKRVLKMYNQDKTFSSGITKELCKKIIDRIGPRPSDDFHLDHIIPLSVFDLTQEIHRTLANSPENLRWLLGKENLSKKDSVDFELIYCSLSLLSIAKQIGLV